MLLQGYMNARPSYWLIPCNDQDNKILNIELIKTIVVKKKLNQNNEILKCKLTCSSTLSRWELCSVKKT